jgi:hypothetical protein
MPAVQTLLAMVTAGMFGRGVGMAAFQADKSLINPYGTGHSVLQVKQNCGKIIGLKLIKGKYGN